MPVSLLGLLMSSFSFMLLSWRGAVLAALGAMKSTLLLDTTFVSDLDAELTRREAGPARAFFDRTRQAEVFVSVVTLEEFSEKRGHEAARELASRFSVLGIHVADALRCGLLQTRSARRLGENDAWLAAQALRGGCSIVTRDRRFDDVPGLKVLNY